MKKLKLALSMVMLSALVISCTKDLNKYPVNVRMTDAPGPYDAVNIDLQGVELTGNDGAVITMNTSEGIYNLLDFTNGADTLIATGDLEVAVLEQIRLILGPNSTIVVDGVSYPLSTPSAEQSGLKLQVHQTLEAGVMYSILLDFDANKSIVVLGNGSYKLKPVLRTVETAISGAIKGKISPAGTMAVITANSSLSYSTNVTTGGDFMIKGLPAGTYTLNIAPAMPFHESNLVNITVTTGVTTDVGTIILE